MLIYTHTSLKDTDTNACSPCCERDQAILMYTHTYIHIYVYTHTCVHDPENACSPYCERDQALLCCPAVPGDFSQALLQKCMHKHTHIYIYIHIYI